MTIDLVQHLILLLEVVANIRQNVRVCPGLERMWTKHLGLHHLRGRG